MKKTKVMEMMDRFMTSEALVSDSSEREYEEPEPKTEMLADKTGGKKTGGKPKRRSSVIVVEEEKEEV